MKNETYRYRGMTHFSNDSDYFYGHRITLCTIIIKQPVIGAWRVFVKWNSIHDLENVTKTGQSGRIELEE